MEQKLYLANEGFPISFPHSRERPSRHQNKVCFCVYRRKTFVTAQDKTFLSFEPKAVETHFSELPDLQKKIKAYTNPT